VQQLGFDPGQTPYRIYARRAGDSQFVLLKDNITIAEGGSFEVKAKSGEYIEEYEEWIVELASTFDDNGFEMEAGFLQGIIAARAILNWPELSEASTTER
jgi:hypothetical protein